ncbi:hypothetical protein Y032_0228g2848 [Ancylostoma ceylanicum]|nr:hypothetical protein Y032_0228g2848 [Ancylostoma ceylanicum]
MTKIADCSFKTHLMKQKQRTDKKCIVYPKRRVRPRGRRSRGGHACQHFTSSSLLCISRFIVIFMISTNDLAVM